MPEELLKAIKEYEQVFEDGFPTIPLVTSKPTEEVIAIIRECFEKKKDVYDLGYLTLDDGIMY